MVGRDLRVSPLLVRQASRTCEGTMFVRVVVFATIVCLLSALVEAQAPGVAVQPRVRITGLRAYEIPGVLKVDGERVTGSSSVTTDEMTVRVLLPQTGQQLVVLKPGKRF